MKNDNLIVFTGGPGAGKTSLLKYLHEKGFNVIPETARQIISDRLKAGFSPRPEPIDFAIQIFDIDVENYMANSNATSATFFDRSFVDSGYMIWDADPSLYLSYETNLHDKKFNSNVFAFPPWKKIYQNDSERDQSFSDAVKTFDKLCNWYRNNGYKLLEVPESSIEMRAAFVLSQLSNLPSRHGK